MLVKPLVSVVMITYGHEKYLREAISGVLSQKCKFEVELIIADDCSPDKTENVIRKIKGSYPNASWIKYIKHKTNLGVMPNFVFALQQAQGKYIALCDGDDFWTDLFKLQKQVDFLEKNSSYVATYHDANIIDERGNLIKESKLPESCQKDFSAIELKKGAYLLTLSLCFRNVITHYPNYILTVANGDTFLISMLGNYGKGKYMDNIKPAAYRVHCGGVWSEVDNIKKLNMRLGLFEALRYFYRKEVEFELFFRNKKRGVMRQLMHKNAQKMNFTAFKEVAAQYSQVEKNDNRISIYTFLLKIYIYYFYMRLRLRLG